MRTILATLALILFLAAPVSAEWTVNGTSATWHSEKALTVVTRARDAILWQRTQDALFGAVVTAALPNLTVTDLGGGTGRVSITMSRSAFDPWAAALVAVICPEAATNPEKLACSDAAIKAAIRQLIHRHESWLREQANPVLEPPEL